ncbi:hypothetical protein ACI3QN_13635, partial [Propionibacterium freudenreichii]|uniref:hypothetical protein n=1 Tax=Propionibacterium freudenreichii TaxID=1744 RepID=UPI003854C63E
MKSLKSIVRKAEKKKARRKDFKKRLNINKNVPTVIVIEEKEKFKSIVTNGKQEYYPGTKTP